jgi:hypothetical protein
MEYVVIVCFANPPDLVQGLGIVFASDGNDHPTIDL